MDAGPKRFFSVACIALGVFWAVGLASFSMRDWPFAAAESIRHVANYSGPLGSLLAWSAVEVFGRAFAWLFPVWMMVLGAATATPWLRATAKWVFKTAVFAVLMNALFALTSYTAGVEALRGGAGDAVASALTMVLGKIGGSIVLIAALLLFILGEAGRLVAVWTRIAGPWRERFPSKADQPKNQTASSARPRGTPWVVPVRGAARLVARGMRAAAGALGGAFRSVRPSEKADVEPQIHGPSAGAAETDDDFNARVWKRPGPDPVDAIEITMNESAAPRKPRKPAKSRAKQPSAETFSGPASDMPPLSEAALPPMTMLEHGVDTKASYSRETLKNWSNVLEEKLRNYGVEGRVSSVHHGPVVTTFEFEPATGVRIKDIVSRADDLALAMRARSLRMIAPIPGRAAVGIEIPNPESRTVYLYDVLNEVTEKQRLSGIMLGLGSDVVGKPFLMNLCEAPHLLVAGTTGSGKSVCLNAILSSILFQYRPSDVEILLVDPKMIEMSMYDGIPHLLHPVITDPKEAAKVLEYLTAEMSRRNGLFRRHGVKNIESYNTKVSLGLLEGVDEEPDRLPYIVLIVDELGDLALAKGVDIESLLARLAQMARAAGIHMILATQRPSVDVIVGKTKANFPTRIAFRVATKIDSRTILDTIGADKLLGKGDMLFTDVQNPQPLRLHGAWVSEKNLEELIAHWKSYAYEPSSLELKTRAAGAARLDEDVDPLFDDAKGVVVQFKQGSTSLLQRKLHIGYARAARLLDQLEEDGIVGPPDGSKPREVYLDSVEEAME